MLPGEQRNDEQAWRVGSHYGIHVYRGDVPVATFHTAADAAAAVEAHNARLASGEQSGDDLLLSLLGVARGRANRARGRANRAETDLAAARRTLDEIRKLCDEADGATSLPMVDIAGNHHSATVPTSKLRKELAINEVRDQVAAWAEIPCVQCGQGRLAFAHTGHMQRHDYEPDTETSDERCVHGEAVGDCEGPDEHVSWPTAVPETRDKKEPT